jgi:hypothetical protein
MLYALKGIEAALYRAFQVLCRTVTVSSILGMKLSRIGICVEERWVEEHGDAADQDKSMTGLGIKIHVLI